MSMFVHFKLYYSYRIMITVLGLIVCVGYLEHMCAWVYLCVFKHMHVRVWYLKHACVCVCGRYLKHARGSTSDQGRGVDDPVPENGQQ